VDQNRRFPHGWLNGTFEISHPILPLSAMSPPSLNPSLTLFQHFYTNITLYVHLEPSQSNSEHE
jgi:hypothetical protein